MPAYEVNFDGIVGPTHNYAGLSYGNIASTKHKLTVSHPKQAALQGLEKMKFLSDLGLKQAILPPQDRPHLPTLRAIGFSGSDAEILAKVHRDHPELLAAVCSSSSMWAANAATVSPPADTADGRIHFTPANLITQFHRSIEPPTTTRILRAIFRDESAFAVHDPLPAAMHFSDEGAANHTRLCREYDGTGIEVFTFGRIAMDPSQPAPKKFPARQTYEASRAIARRNLLNSGRTIFYRQDADAIDAGAFHNDVVAVGNRDVFFFHERGIADKRETLEEMQKMFHETCGSELRLIQVYESDVSLQQAIDTYLFNSQLVTLPNGRMALIAPTECRENAQVHAYLRELLARGAPISDVHYVDVRQSMQNGGGPACLRLRVVMDDQQLARMHDGVLFSDELHAKLVAWVEKHYRDRLSAGDLADPKLLDDSRRALDELTQTLNLGSIYEFQRA